jgi:hypothetical protein
MKDFCVLVIYGEHSSLPEIEEVLERDLLCHLSLELSKECFLFRGKV